MRRPVQHSKQWPEMAGVLAPATHGAGIERLADLPLTESGDHALRAMKLQAGGLPVQAEKIDQPLALSLKVGNQAFVANLVETKRQRLAPVVAKPLHSERAATAVGEIVSERMESLNEQLKVARQADIPSVAPAKYDTGLREQLGGEAKMQHVARQLVRDPPRATAETLQIFDMHLGQSACQHWIHMLCRSTALALAGQCCGDPPNLLQLPGAEHLGMARRNLFDQRGTGPRHADDEDRQFASGAALRVGESFGRIILDEQVNFPTKRLPSKRMPWAFITSRQSAFADT